MGAEGSVPQGTSPASDGVNGPSLTMLPSQGTLQTDTRKNMSYPPLSASPDLRFHAKTGGLTAHQTPYLGAFLLCRMDETRIRAC